MNLKDLIGETTEYDKKEMLEVKDPKSWLKSVSAFANGLLFGIDNNDNILGLSTHKENSERISEIIKNHIDSIPQFDSDKSSFVLILKNIQYSGVQPGAEAGPVPGPVPSPVTISDIIKGKVTEKDYYVLFDTISDNRKYDGQILLLCLKPRSRKELQILINIKSETYMKTNVLKPLIEKEYLCLTNPDVPNDMNQKYYTNPKIIYKNIIA